MLKGTVSELMFLANAKFLEAPKETVDEDETVLRKRDQGHPSTDQDD